MHMDILGRQRTRACGTNVLVSSTNSRASLLSFWLGFRPPNKNSCSTLGSGWAEAPWPYTRPGPVPAGRCFVHLQATRKETGTQASVCGLRSNATQASTYFQIRVSRVYTSSGANTGSGDPSPLAALGVAAAPAPPPAGDANADEPCTAVPLLRPATDMDAPTNWGMGFLLLLRGHFRVATIREDKPAERCSQAHRHQGYNHTQRRSLMARRDRCEAVLHTSDDNYRLVGSHVRGGVARPR